MLLLVICLSLIFILGYGMIIFEHNIGINKAAAALLTAVVLWAIYLVGGQGPLELRAEQLKENLADASAITFFLFGAMTIVELIDMHKGFQVITRWLAVSTPMRLLWVIGIVSFFLSAVLDNLTSCIVMVSLLRKLLKNQEQRWLIGSLVVIAVNAGGAWTPIGDVTTTMLWIKGNITTANIIQSLFLPSLVCLIVAILGMSLLLGRGKAVVAKMRAEAVAPGGVPVLCIGFLSLMLVPVYKEFFHLPPYLGVLFGVGLLWLFTDLLHRKKEKGRAHLCIPQVFARIDTSTVLFFLGILLAVSALDAASILANIATWLSQTLGSINILTLVIGVISAVIDNVPLVAAVMGMYDLVQYPVNHALWELLAYCAGTGGSILVIGSAAGVAFMGIEKVNFIWYFRRVSLIAFIAYLAGFATYLGVQYLGS